MSATPARALRSPRTWIGLALLVLLIVLVQRTDLSVPSVLRAIEGLGPWAAVAYIGAYAVATVAWIPGSILTLASGALFGVAAGTVYTLVGATLGAALAFLVSRYLARGLIEARLGTDPRLAAIDDALAREGPRIVFLIRLSPAFPFNALNYAFGLTRVRFRDYLIASPPGMAPGTFLYVYAGHTAGAVAGGTGPSSPASTALLVVGLLATVAATALVTRTARRSLATASAKGVALAGHDDTAGADPPPSGAAGPEAAGPDARRPDATDVGTTHPEAEAAPSPNGTHPPLRGADASGGRHPGRSGEPRG